MMEITIRVAENKSYEEAMNATKKFLARHDGAFSEIKLNLKVANTTKFKPITSSVIKFLEIHGGKFSKVEVNTSRLISKDGVRIGTYHWEK